MIQIWNLLYLMVTIEVNKVWIQDSEVTYFFLIQVYAENVGSHESYWLMLLCISESRWILEVSIMISSTKYESLSKSEEYQQFRSSVPLRKVCVDPTKEKVGSQLYIAN